MADGFGFGFGGVGVVVGGGIVMVMVNDGDGGDDAWRWMVRRCTKLHFDDDASDDVK